MGRSSAVAPMAASGSKAAFFLVPCHVAEVPILLQKSPKEGGGRRLRNGRELGLRLLGRSGLDVGADARCNSDPM
jgi:hypothetical protein